MLVENTSKSFTNLMAFSETLLGEGKTLQVTVGGISMFPFLKKGDRVFIKNFETNKYNKGDIIVFKTSDKFIAHRLIFFKTIDSVNYVLTKGDSVLKFDIPMPLDSILGKIIFLARGMKTIDLNTRKSQAKALRIAILSPYLIPVYWMLRKFYAIYRKLIIKLKN